MVIIEDSPQLYIDHFDYYLSVAVAVAVHIWVHESDAVAVHD